MTETLPSPETKSARRSCWKRKLFCFLFFIALVAVCAVGFTHCPWFVRMHGNAGSEDIVQMQQRITTLESQVRELGQQYSDLNARGATTAPAATTSTDTTAPASATNAAPTLAAADIAHMQNDLVALSSAVSALQAEVKQTGSHAAESRQATQASLAAAIAFIQLRETAAAGQVFSNELAAMREAAKDDAAFQEQLGKLEALAPKGAPTIAALNDELLTLEHDATLAIEKANAQNWWERLLAEMKTLVSVRKQHGGGATDAFTDMENDLSKGDIAATLNDMQNLPPEAQQVLAGWRAKAEARQAVDTALRDMAAHFTALAVPPVKPADSTGAP